MPRPPVAALAVVLLALTSCGPAAPDPEAEVGPRPGWTRLPDHPLSSREGSAIAHVATEDGRDLVVVVGGYTGPPCPPNADCEIPEDAMATDGAALDLEAGTWQEIADVPGAVSWYASTAVVGDTLFVLTDAGLLAWDASEDAWAEVEPPQRPSDLVGALVADDHSDPARLLVVSGSDERGERPDLAYEPLDGSWTRLPPDPLTPSFDRQIIPTPLGLVLTARPIAPDGGPENPALVRAALLEPGATRWRTVYPGGDQLGGWSWAWTGHRLVDPTPGGADGGQVNGFGRTIPYGGALDLGSGEWTALSDTPDAWSGGWSVEAVGGRLHAVQGWIYDDGESGRGSSWTRTLVPEGAPEEPGRAVWVDDALVVVGGADWDRATSSPDDVRSTGTWVLRMK
jgi:hypothetical protein